MKKVFLVCIAVAIGFFSANAQSYTTGIGLGFDFGEGITYVGPTIKHFLNEKGALEGDVMFAKGSTMVTAMYQYHGSIADEGGLKYYLGAGPSLQFGGSNTYVAIRPVGGLDYKVKNAPLSINFDWRPALWFYSGSTDFAPGRFGMGFKFVLGK